MENFTFHNPTKIIFGKKTIKQIGREISRNKHKKVLLIAGGGSIKTNGVYEAVAGSLEKHGIQWTEVWGVVPNPVLSKVNQAGDRALEWGADAILAVGGGSVIDTAKATAAGVYLSDVWDAFTGKVFVEKALPVYTVLTLSATGSEMNGNAVITREDGQKKWPVGSPALYPRVSVIDPRAQYTLPWNQTVNGAVDALSHIMEYYFMGSTQETTLALDEALCRTIIQATDKLRKNAQNYDARADLAWSATLALNGISGIGLAGGDWSAHFIEHGISALFPKVAHGAGLAVVFPAWILFMRNENPNTFSRWAKNVWNKDSVEDAVKSMREKYHEWGAPVTLSELGASEKDVDTVAAKVMEFAEEWHEARLARLKNLGPDGVRAILRLAL